MMLQLGLYFEIFLADTPDFVTMITAAAFKSMAVVQAAWPVSYTHLTLPTKA